MSCIFQSCSESQIGISAWNKSSHLILFSPFCKKPPPPASPLPLGHLSQVTGGELEILPGLPNAADQVSHQLREGSQSRRKSPVLCWRQRLCPLQLYARVPTLLRRSWELGRSHHAPSCGCWAARPTGRLHLSDGFPHLCTTLQWHDCEKPTHFFSFLKHFLQ